MKISKKIMLSIFTCFFSLLGMASAVYALVQETVKITNMGFEVASSFDGSATPTPTPTSANSSLKMLKQLDLGSASTNLSDTVSGIVFKNMTPTFDQSFPIKVYNQGQVNLNLVASADYISDPNTLRDDIFVAVYEWNDTNSNGVVDSNELGTKYGEDTILRLKNDTFALGAITPNQIKGLVYKFKGTGLSSANYGQSAVFDFKLVGSE